MTFSAAPETSPIVTLVVRAWVASPSAQPRELRYQATHIQTGEVSYFGSLDAVAQYVRHLSERLTSRLPDDPPIDLARWRRA